MLNRALNRNRNAISRIAAINNTSTGIHNKGSNSINKNIIRNINTSASRKAVRMTYPQWDSGVGKQVPSHEQHGLYMFESDTTPPSSEYVIYDNTFIHKVNPKDHAKPWETVGHEKADRPMDLVESSGDPHASSGFVAKMMYKNYQYVREPVFPRQPNVVQGELAAGANLHRTSVFTTMQPDEPAIVQIAAFSPDNFQHADLAKNMPWPESSHNSHNVDFRQTRLPIGHADRKPFVFFCAAGVFGGMALFVRHLIIKIGYMWWPRKQVFVAGTTEVDLSKIEMGQNFIAKWRSKPMFIRRRTAEQIALAKKDDAMMGLLRDPAKDEERVLRPEWLVCSGSCTHLGCVPFPDAGDYGGWFCSCHGSHYDYSGRIRKGPAPRNLPIPPYKFVTDTEILIG